MSKPLIGKITVPGDKSLSHRVAIFSAMAEGVSMVSGLLDSSDLRSTLGILRALGAKIDLQVDGFGLTGSISGWGSNGPMRPPEQLDCGNSGTTARLMLGVLSGYGIIATLVGDNSLSKRPMRRVTTPLELMGARFAPSDKLPITVGMSVGDTFAVSHGGIPLKEGGMSHPKLQAINYQSPVASAQIKSAILLAGLNADGRTVVSEPHKSRDHTELMLSAYGIQVEISGLSVSLKGGQQLQAYDCSVPGDPSSAAFMVVAAATATGSDVTVKNMLLNPTRIGFLQVMRDMGADVSIEQNKAATIGAEIVGSIRVRYKSGLKAVRVMAKSIPSLIDEIPILSLLASAAEGETVFEQVGELRVKESDRLTAIVDGLQALGVDAWTEREDLHIVGDQCLFSKRAVPTPHNYCFSTHGDHRLAMTWAIAERAFDLDLNISDRDCVKVSYPGFFADLRRLSYC